MSDFFEALQREIEGIERELDADPRYIKLKSLKQVLSLYDSTGVARERVVAPEIPRTVTRQQSEGRAKAIELAELYLRNRNGPTATRDIYNHIEMHGGEIGGKDPVNNLSAMLSNSELFQSNGRAGWTLATKNGPPITDEQYQNAVDSILADLDSGELLDANSYNQENHRIPENIDRKLLTEARKIISRHLTSVEMSKLREYFLKTLSSQI